ncbi:MAG: hypothetical protein IPH94_15320 [Saprospiraceae bacterium]|nr:hypothetical protein [Saprospiraceae bacterium]
MSKYPSYLNNAGTSTITATQINNGSGDACGIASLTLNNSNFTCANTGSNTVVLTVTDKPMAACAATVSVQRHRKANSHMSEFDNLSEQRRYPRSRLHRLTMAGGWYSLSLNNSSLPG